MAAEDHELGSKYNVLRLSIISSSAISNRTTALIKHLKTEEIDGKTAVVSLHAKASVVNKLISVVEIAKRELKQSEIRLYQYNALGSEVVNLRPTNQSDRQAEEADHMSDGEEAFEVMGAKPTVRNVPTMTVYLSPVPVKELKESYGEQIG